MNGGDRPAEGFILDIDTSELPVTQETINKFREEWERYKEAHNGFEGYLIYLLLIERRKLKNAKVPVKKVDHNESNSKKYLRIVNELAEIFEREGCNEDDLFFIIRTLKNIFLFDDEAERRSHDYHRGLENFMKYTSNREWMKNNFNFKDAT